MTRLFLLFVLALCPAVCTAAPPAAAPAAAKPAALPQIPEILKPLQARITNGEHIVPGLGPILNLTAHEPPTEEQWKAIEDVGIRSFNLAGKGFGDAAMPRFAKLDPTALLFWEMPMTDAGAEHLASMKSLRALLWVHAGAGITKQVAHVVENHPALEYLVMPITWFVDPPTFARIIPSCKRLRVFHAGHFGDDAQCKVLEHHPAIEDIFWWPDWTFITDAGLTSLTTLPKLKKLKLEFCRLTYDGSLKRLKDVPGLESLTFTNTLISDDDLARLKADLPNVKITHTPMKPDFQATFERREAMRDLPQVLKDAKAQLTADPLDAGRTMLVLSSTAAATAEEWAAIEPLRARFGIRAFGLSGKVGDDATVSRLAAYDPTTLVLTSCPVTDAGLAHVAGMKSLRGLHLANCGGLTPPSAAIVMDHPTIANLVLPPAWANDPATFKAVLAMPRLTGIVLSQGNASDAACAVLARHPALEQLTLAPQGTAGPTNAALASLATVPTLAKLSISSARLTYDGGLEHLAKLPALTSLTLSNVLASQEDIDRLKAAVPKTTTVAFAAMPPTAIPAFEKLEAARKQAADLAKLPEADRAARLADLQKADPAASAAVRAELKGLVPHGGK